MKKPIKNYIFAVIFSFVHLQKMRTLSEIIVNLYQHQRVTL